MSRCRASCPLTTFELKDPSECSIRSVFNINLDTERKSLQDDAVANAFLSEIPSLMCHPISKPGAENLPDVVAPLCAIKSEVGDTDHFWKARTVLQILVFRVWEDTGLFSLVGGKDELSGLRMLTLEVDKWRSNALLLRAVPQHEFSLPDLIGITYSLMTSIGNSLYPWLFTPTRRQARVHDVFFFNLLLLFRRFSFAVLPDEFLTKFMTVLASTNVNATAADIVATPVAIRAEISSMIADLSSGSSTMQVLDQTCGTGTLLCDLRRQCPNVFGIDLAPFAALASDVRLLLDTSRQYVQNGTRVASSGFECQPVLCANALHLLGWSDAFTSPYVEAPFEELSPENRSALSSELWELGNGIGFACVVTMPPLTETNSAPTSNFVASSAMIPLPCKRMPLYQYFLLPPMQLLAPDGVLIAVLPLSFFRPAVSQIWLKFFERMRLQRVIVCSNNGLNGRRANDCIVVARKRRSSGGGSNGGGALTACSCYNIELRRVAETAHDVVSFSIQKPTQLWSKLCELAQRRRRIVVVENETARASVRIEVERTTLVGQFLQRIVGLMNIDNSEQVQSCTFRNVHGDWVDCLALKPNERLLDFVAASQTEPRFNLKTAPSKKQKLRQNA